jgi:endonuclease/exonuclease/phosphatase family metal-dependent hydrolase
MLGRFLRNFLRFLFIAINLIAGLGLVLACYGNKLDQEKFWFVNLAALSTIYLLLLLLLMMLGWLFVKPKRAFISLIAFIICWSPLKNVVGLKFPEKFRFEKNSQDDLRIMTWNVEHFGLMDYKHHPEVKDSMIHCIRRYDPDIACFQEMTCSDSVPYAINYLPRIADSIRMPYYHYAYRSKFNFDKKHHFGIIIFSKYPLVNKKIFSGNLQNYNEIFQYADIARNRDTIRVFNLHLQTFKFNKENRIYLESPTMDDETDLRNSANVLHKIRKNAIRHKEQSDRIRQEIDKSPYPMIVCGDFNDVPNSYAYRTIGSGLKNAFRERGSGIDRTFSGISPTLRIDNIFCDDRFQVKQYDRMTRPYSDHYPVIADLFLSSPVVP